MYTIEMEKECSCFKKSGLDSVMEFETREDMYNKARVLECRMNQEFCMKHYFQAVDHGEKIIIRVSERPADDEEDEDVTDAGTLVRNSNVVIGFDGSQVPPKDSGSN